ncbi:DUF4113 domain-containing protein [Comamonas jiangduensis]|uniref:DUF4113 domain-containing protein n=1 Tax=Comamonas jiangduensis TaxID=1194168 RepID=UPI003BF84115
MEAMGRINGRDGKATARIVSRRGTQKDEAGLRTKQGRRTPRYTTELDETPIACA